MPAGRRARPVPGAPAGRARRRPLRRRDPGGGRRRAGGPDADRRGRGLRRGRRGGGRARAGPRCPRRPRATSSRSTRRGPSSPAATTAARSTASPPSSSSSTAGASRASPCARRSCATGRSCPCAGSTSTCRAATSSTSPAGTMRDLLLRFKFNGIVLEVGGGHAAREPPRDQRRAGSGPSPSGTPTARRWTSWARASRSGTAQRFAASLHVGVGGGSYVEKDDVRRLAEWADLYGLEIVPEVQALSHTYYIASARRDLAEDPEMAWPDSYCPSNPESYRIYFDVLDEYLDVLRPKRVHIGHDEWRAGAFCPRCRGKDTGALYAEDVLKIHRHLREKGIETWMWGDHFVDGHNRFGKQWAEGGVVRYERPDTTSARDRVAAETSDIHILNWSGEEGDATFQKLGWPFVVGNFAGSEEKDWRGRVARHGALGGEVSSWGAWEEFVLGKLQVAGGRLQQQPPLVRARPEERGCARARGPPAPRRAGDAGVEAAALVRRRPDALRGPRHRLRLQPPAQGRRLGPRGPAPGPALRRRAALRDRRPRALGRPLGGEGRATPGRHAHPRGAPDPGPLGLARVHPVRERRGPAHDPRRRPDPLPARVLGAPGLLRDPLRGRPGRDPRDPLRRDGRPLGRRPRPAPLLRASPRGGDAARRPRRGRVGERVGEPAARRARSRPSPSWDRPGPRRPARSCSASPRSRSRGSRTCGERARDRLAVLPPRRGDRRPLAPGDALDRPPREAVHRDDRGLPRGEPGHGPLRGRRVAPLDRGRDHHLHVPGPVRLRRRASPRS